MLTQMITSNVIFAQAIYDADYIPPTSRVGASLHARTVYNVYILNCGGVFLYTFVCVYIVYCVFMHLCVFVFHLCVLVHLCMCVYCTFCIDFKGFAHCIYIFQLYI